MLLRKLQQAWQQGVFDESAQPILPLIVNPEERADVYIDGYRARLIEALEKTFPLLLKNIGEEAFCELALNYIDAYPSEYYTLSFFGKYFSVFLRQHSNAALAEIADLDWAISSAVDSSNAKPITRDDLQKVTPEQWSDMQFALHPSFTLLDKYRVYRKQTQVYYVEVTSQERQILQLIKNKATFGEICEQLCETFPEDEVVNFIIQQLLRWLDDELIVGITFSEIKETA